MNNWKVILATVVIFGAGVLTGGLLVNHVQPVRPKPPHNKPTAPPEGRPASSNSTGHASENPRPRPPEILSKQFLQRLNEELRLSAEQHEAIQKIIAERQNQMRRVVQDARLEIREALTPEQQKQFEELVKRPFRRPIFGTNATVVLPAITNAPPPATNAP